MNRNLCQKEFFSGRNNFRPEVLLDLIDHPESEVIGGRNPFLSGASVLVGHAVSVAAKMLREILVSPRTFLFGERRTLNGTASLADRADVFD